MEQFLSVNLVSIVQLVSFVGGGIWLISAMKSVQEVQSKRLESVERELSKLRDVVVEIARQEERLNAMDQRMLLNGKRLDRVADQLFRHGKTAQEETF